MFPDYKRVAVETMVFSVQSHMSKLDMALARDQIELACRIDEVSQALVAEIRWWMAGKRETDATETTIEHPADWWQAFKARWFDNRLLRWLLRRYPVRMAQHKVATQIVHETRVCPHLPLVRNSKGGFASHTTFLFQDGHP